METKSNKLGKFTFTQSILNTLLDLGKGLYSLTASYELFKRNVPRWRYNHAIRYLQKTGKIALVRKNEKLFIELTKKGKIHILLRKVEMGTSSKIQPWDGKWRLVIWDIPEASNKERDRIRYFLKSVGFHLLQKSVFIRPHQLSSDAVQYLRESGLIRFIHFLRVDRIDDERYLFKKFGLHHTKK